MHGVDSPPLASLEALVAPRPRPERTPAQLAQIRVQNRRREYLVRNPDYFKSSEHELADPLLHDFLIRRFQTPAEREAEGRQKGYARVLEGSLLRGEERLAKMAQASQTNNMSRDSSAPAQSSIYLPMEGVEPAPQQPLETETYLADMSSGFSSLAAEMALPAKTKEGGREQWEAYLRDRFIRGEDDDFEYSLVDNDDDFDVLERQDEEEAWFDADDPNWASDEADSSRPGSSDQDQNSKGPVERILNGETGIQDF
ncbi:coiled-coil domain-containing protein-domain-containing protein [Podospora didyma]|uniref:Coiled-coil domain-containing protein-domain-containing protein n=1 Tax=Podospora didyma TaxID=330526 RepID=A0AAE0K9C6_9PEZI|nr:coiled-coil domain-containing protein-domain-containing protein [Podospora didyma]